MRICSELAQGVTWLPLHTRQLVDQTFPVFQVLVPIATPLDITTTLVLQGCAAITERVSDVSGAISQPTGTDMYCDCVVILHPSTSTPDIVEYCHDPDTVTVLEL